MGACVVLAAPGPKFGAAVAGFHKQEAPKALSSNTGPCTGIVGVPLKGFRGLLSVWYKALSRALSRVDIGL